MTMVLAVIPVSAPKPTTRALEGEVVPQSAAGYATFTEKAKWTRRGEYVGRHVNTSTLRKTIASIAKRVTIVAKTTGSWVAKLYPSYVAWLDSKMVLPAPTATPENYKLMSKAMRNCHDNYVSRWATAA